VPREKEQLSLFSPPFIKPVRLLTADELFYKSAPAAARERLHRARRADLATRGVDGERVPFTGKVKCLDGDSGEIVAELAYGTISKTVPAKAWSDPTSDPLADLRGALRLVSGACRASADLVVMGKSAADAFESIQIENLAGRARGEKRLVGRSESGVVPRPALVCQRERISGRRQLDETVRARRLCARRRKLACGLLRLRGSPAGRSGRARAARLRGNARPTDQLRELRRHQEVSLVFATRSRTAKLERVDDSRRALSLQSIQRKEKLT
jgi:hypothetical protein